MPMNYYNAQRNSSKEKSNAIMPVLAIATVIMFIVMIAESIIKHFHS